MSDRHATRPSAAAGRWPASAHPAVGLAGGDDDDDGREHGHEHRRDVVGDEDDRAEPDARHDRDGHVARATRGAPSGPSAGRRPWRRLASRCCGPRPRCSSSAGSSSCARAPASRARRPLRRRPPRRRSSSSRVELPGAARVVVAARARRRPRRRASRARTPPPGRSSPSRPGATSATGSADHGSSLGVSPSSRARTAGTWPVGASVQCGSSGSGDVPRTNDQSSSEASGGASSSVGRPTAWWAPVIVTPVASFDRLGARGLPVGRPAPVVVAIPQVAPAPCA